MYPGLVGLPTGIREAPPRVGSTYHLPSINPCMSSGAQRTSRSSPAACSSILWILFGSKGSFCSSPKKGAVEISQWQIMRAKVFQASVWCRSRSATHPGRTELLQAALSCAQHSLRRYRVEICSLLSFSGHIFLNIPNTQSV